MNAQYDFLTILGPTASGKTKLAAHLASLLDAEIISGDSRQVYRQMDIGTGKDISEYNVKGKPIPYHLIDIASPGYKYNIYEYQRDFLKVYSKIKERNRMPILCGGSGLYIESVLRGYRLMPVPQNDTLRSSLRGKTLEELTVILASYKKLHNTTDTDTINRAIRGIEIEEYYKNLPPTQRFFPDFKSLNIGLSVNKEIRWKRIQDRLQKRLKKGLIEEVEHLLKQGISADDLIYYGLEYKYITLYLTQRLTYDEMCSELNIAIRQFSKRQMTWFRGMERRGIKIHWLDAEWPIEENINQIMYWLDKSHFNL